VIPELPFARYFCQTINLPDVSTSAVEVPSQFSVTKRHGDTLRWSDLSMTVLVDEELRVWEETLDWLKSLTKPTTFNEYGKRKATEYAKYYDGILTLNTNANVPHMRIKFYNVHPTMMGQLIFDTTTSAEQTINLDISFAYDYFEIERI
jgi:hypothetical protein